MTSLIECAEQEDASVADGRWQMVNGNMLTSGSAEWLKWVRFALIHTLPLLLYQHTHIADVGADSTACLHLLADLQQAKRRCQSLAQLSTAHPGYLLRILLN